MGFIDTISGINLEKENTQGCYAVGTLCKYSTGIKHLSGCNLEKPPCIFLFFKTGRQYHFLPYPFHNQVAIIQLVFCSVTTTFSHKTKRVVPFVFIIIVLINYVFFESIFTRFNSSMLGLEALVILFYCMVYFLNLLIEEEAVSYKKNTTFWMVTGISIYVVINFPIFIFYKSFSDTALKFAVGIWDLHNITYIMLCIFMAKYFYNVSNE